MNKEQLKSLESIREIKATIRVDELEDRSDRTLLWGYTCNRDSFHVYLKDGVLHHVIYAFEKISTPLYTKVGFELPLEGIVPDKRLYPDACDYEFCELLKMAGVYLPFTTFNEDRKEAKFYGEIIRD